MPEMGVGQVVGTGQSESLSGSDASGGGGGDGGLSIYNGLSLDASQVILVSGESRSLRMMDVGRSGSDLNVHRQQVMRHFRQELQLQLQQLQQQRPLPLNFPCSPHHQANEHHNNHRRTPRPDSPGNKRRAVGRPPQQRLQQQDQPRLAQLQGIELGWLARADEQSGGSRFVRTGGGVNRMLPSFPPVSKPGSGAGEGFRGGAVNRFHPPPPPLPWHFP